MVRVKICGLTNEEDMGVAIESGADAVGFIVGFPASPRNITLPKAAALIRKVPPFVDSVLVATLNALKEDMGGARSAHPGSIQLYTDSANPEGLRQSLGVRLIRPYLLAAGDVDAAVRASMGFDALLTDTYVAGLRGGTGLVSDWAMCDRIRSAIAPLPLILSGGLKPENVAAAVRSVHPFAVDVSSGVERSPGLKDHRKVAEFIRLAKDAV